MITWELIGTALTLLAWAGIWIVDQRRPYTVRFLAAYAGFYGAFAVVFTIAGGLSTNTLTAGAFAAWCTYHAWKRRPPRHGKPSKAAGIIRDLGHRLIVSNA
jgi:hypothetical protein